MLIDNGISHMLVYGYMPYKTGYWGEQAKERSKRRREYFSDYQKNKDNPKKVFRLGEFGEALAIKTFTGAKLENRTGYDMIWKNKKIEVKTSEKGDAYNNHRFDIRIQKKENKADYFLTLILDEHTKELQSAYLIPNKAINARVTLCISQNGRSKYESYKLRI